MDTNRIPSQLLDSETIGKEYLLGRDLRLKLMKRLPHVRVGRAGPYTKLLVRRADLEAVLGRASREGTDLWELVRSDVDLAWWAGIHLEGANNG